MQKQNPELDDVEQVQVDDEKSQEGQKIKLGMLKLIQHGKFVDGTAMDKSCSHGLDLAVDTL